MKWYEYGGDCGAIGWRTAHLHFPQEARNGLNGPGHGPHVTPATLLKSGVFKNARKPVTTSNHAPPTPFRGQSEVLGGLCDTFLARCGQNGPKWAKMAPKTCKTHHKGVATHTRALAKGLEGHIYLLSWVVGSLRGHCEVLRGHREGFYMVLGPFWPILATSCQKGVAKAS